MKKTFSLTAANKTPERHVDSIKHEIKKYVARERRKPLSEGVDFWDFDCRIGALETDAEHIFVNEIKEKVNDFVSKGRSSFYLEILAKPGKYSPKPRKPEKLNIEEEEKEKLSNEG